LSLRHHVFDCLSPSAVWPQQSTRLIFQTLAKRACNDFGSSIFHLHQPELAQPQFVNLDRRVHDPKRS
jgi:hypothetical protein